MKKMSWIIVIALSVLFNIGCGQARVSDVPAKYKLLKAGEVMPSGWIREQMHKDINEGYYGKYDKVNYTVTHNLFVNKNRVSSKQYDGMKCWWSGEHEAYWKDGVLRMAFLTEDENYKKRAIQWLDDILKHCDTDDYIGIYKSGESANSRYRHEGENGELWTQSRMMQALIAGYEFTGDERYFEALKKAVDLTISKYPASYFKTKKQAGGGVSHGIGFFDTLYYMYFKTMDQKYADFAVFLYKDFNESSVRDYDLKTEDLLGTEGFIKHGAHISEGFHMPFFIASLTNDQTQKTAASRALEKLKFHLTPSGAMTCAEDVKDRTGTSETGYEYCGITEMIPSFNKVIALTGNIEVADLAETMALNAGQGARMPVLKALSYVSFDNRIEIDENENYQRHAYSAYHDAAACCTLNGGRLMPYYVEGMWMRDAAREGLTAMLYGPCSVHTIVNDTAVEIIEETTYPFANDLVLKVNPEKPVRFALSFRVPESAEDISVDGISKAEIARNGRLLTIDRTWKAGDSFRLNMKFSVTKLQQHIDGKRTPEYYLKRGPLVYALKIPAKFTELENLNNSDFFRYKVEAENRIGWDYKMGSQSEFKLVKNSEGDILHPWASSPVSLKGIMVDRNGKDVEVNFVPQGNTVLRRVTFPVMSRPRN